MDEHEQLEFRLRQAANDFSYPPTPPLRYVPAKTTAAIYSHRQRVMLVCMVILSLILIYPISAAVLERLQIGSITLFVGEQPQLTAEMPSSLVNLTGKTSLAEAVTSLGFSPRLPPEFGLPDAVYVQESGGKTMILVWLDDAIPGEIALSLYQIPYNDIPAYGKLVSVAQNIEINGQPAVWVDVPHTLQYQAGEATQETQTYLVEGNVLIWYENQITYRLESHFSQEQVIIIAESLR